MMYIRTKDGVYEVDEIKPYFLDEKQKLYINNELKVAINEQQVIKQSEKLEDLIDNSIYFIDGLFGEERKITWYGAIYTEKGIITVAKTNDKGELVLI